MFNQEKIQKEMEELHKSIKETAAENITEMQLLDAIIRINTANTDIMSGVVEIMQSTANNMGRMLRVHDSYIEAIKHLQEHVRELYKIIHELAPDYEIIETMAETAEERAAMCNAYMNHGEWSNAADDTEHEKRDQS